MIGYQLYPHKTLYFFTNLINTPNITKALFYMSA
jgi:hypothetical protein